jgi:hypothetical protein
MVTMMPPGIPYPSTPIADLAPAHVHAGDILPPAAPLVIITQSRRPRSRSPLRTEHVIQPRPGVTFIPSQPPVMGGPPTIISWRSHSRRRSRSSGRHRRSRSPSPSRRSHSPTTVQPQGPMMQQPPLQCPYRDRDYPYSRSRNYHPLRHH